MQVERHTQMSSDPAAHQSGAIGPHSVLQQSITSFTQSQQPTVPFPQPQQLAVPFPQPQQPIASFTQSQQPTTSLSNWQQPITSVPQLQQPLTSFQRFQQLHYTSSQSSFIPEQRMSYQGGESSISQVKYFRLYINVTSNFNSPMLYTPCLTPSHVTGVPGVGAGAFATKSPSKMLSINEGIKRALAIVISWCVKTREQYRKATRGSNKIWACDFLAFQQGKIINGLNTVVIIHSCNTTHLEWTVCS